MRLRTRLRTTLLAAIAALALTGPALAQNAVIDAYNAYIAAFDAGDQAGIDAAIATMSAECGTLGFTQIDACVAAAQAPRPQAPTNPTPEELEAAFQQETAGPIEDFNNAYNSALNGGDLAQAHAQADNAKALLAQICANYGRGDLANCLGQFAELPQPPQGPTPEELEAAFQQEIAGPIEDFTNAVYLVHGGGDFDQAKAMAEAAKAKLTQICANYGRGELRACIGEFPDLEPLSAKGRFSLNLQQAYNNYYNAISAAATDYDSAKMAGDAAAARILQLCNDNGFATIAECSGEELPGFPARTTTADTPAPTTQEQLDARFTQEINVAVSDYQAAVDMAASGGDVAQAQALANDAASRIEQICAIYGRDPDPSNCIGRALPQFPQSTPGGADTQVATPATGAPDTANLKQRLQHAVTDFQDSLGGAQAGDQQALQIAHDAQKVIFQTCADLNLSLLECVGAEALPALPSLSQHADIQPQTIIDADADGFVASADCDDGNASVYPGAPEAADGIDNDCDGVAEGVTAAGGTATPPALTPEQQDELTAEIRAAYADYTAAVDQAARGDHAIARPLADAAQARLAAACTTMGAASVTDCIGFELPAFPEAPAGNAVAGGSTPIGSDPGAADPAPPPTVPPVLSDGRRSAEQRRAADAQAAYLSASNEATTGNYNVAREKARNAMDELFAACSALGVPEMIDCIGEERLPPFPANPRLASAPPASDPAAAAPAAPPAAGAGTDPAQALLAARQTVRPAYDAYVALVTELEIAGTSAGASERIQNTRTALASACQDAGLGAVIESCLVSVELEPLRSPPPETAPVSVPDMATEEERQFLAAIQAISDTLARTYTPAVQGDKRSYDEAKAALVRYDELCADTSKPYVTRTCSQLSITPLDTAVSAYAAELKAGRNPEQAAEAQAGLARTIDAYESAVTQLAADSANVDARAALTRALGAIGDLCNVLGHRFADTCLEREGLPPLSPEPPRATAVADVIDPSAGAGGADPAFAVRMEPYLQQVARARSAIAAAGESDALLKDYAYALGDLLAACKAASGGSCSGTFLEAIDDSIGSSWLSDDGKARFEGLWALAMIDRGLVREATHQQAVAALVNVENGKELALSQALLDVYCRQQNLSQADCVASLKGNSDASRTALADLTAVFRQVQSSIAESGDTFVNLSELAAIVEQIRQRCGLMGYPDTNLCLTRQGHPAIEPADILDIGVPGTRVAVALARAGLGEYAAAYVVYRDQPGADATLDGAFKGISAACSHLGYGSVQTCLTAEGYAGLFGDILPGGPATNPPVADPRNVIRTAVADYNVNTTTGANPAFNREQEMARIVALCEAAGLGAPESCLEALGLVLAEGPVVTKEVVATTADPAKIADLLDSNKTPATTPATATGGRKPASTVLTLGPAAKPPTTDREAQALLPFKAPSINLEIGTALPGGASLKFTAPELGFSVSLGDRGMVLKLGSQDFISNPEQERRRLFDADSDRVSYHKFGDGRLRETIERDDGFKIVTIRKPDGEVERRSRFSPEGKEFVLARGRDDFDFDDTDGKDWGDPGDSLPPLRLAIDARDYVLDTADADADDVAFFLLQPPVERVARIYEIGEVRKSARLRDSVRRLEIGGLTFESGKSTLPRSQLDALDEVADAMLDLLDRNPAETFLIEGHTDAVGDEISNLALSDDRALAIARTLADEFGVPPENLATQGYGETFLKVKTANAERANRRVTIRRITALITTVASAD